ncbi:PEP-CTERM sorting domain-containing protein [Massilia atriviolacea]|uniref:PEP-CTERM sorting domain-containing protein n=1 Tax=Massilia atriviolacea TaxID=2495579 RepID=A0A430HQQ3_9BURK|nr:PEP-CTERM sorting domain-containing protein [Massilia atriviolacea]RSZ59848.1 PEP-CTERM sorting domain-containing protein [Massilia atriviolacea]
MFKRFTRTALAVALLAACAGASAGVLRIGQRGALAQAGQIVQTSNFDDFGAGYHFPGSGFTRGGVTYNSDENLIVGSGAGAGAGIGIGTTRPVMSNEYWSPIIASIASIASIGAEVRYDLFGFDAAVSGGSVEVLVATNLGSYRFDGIALADGLAGLDFLGFQATGGEYFTGFELRSMGEGYLAGITNVALGSARAAVPEPGALALLLLGLALLAARVRGWTGTPLVR